MYRVWCKNKNEWEQNVLLASNGMLFEYFNNRLITLSDKTHILQLSTQVADINNTVIYDGDLLMSSRLTKPIQVWYEEGNWLAGFKDINERCEDYLWRTLLQFPDCVIVGNIFEGVTINDM